MKKNAEKHKHEPQSLQQDDLHVHDSNESVTGKMRGGGRHLWNDRGEKHRGARDRGKVDWGTKMRKQNGREWKSGPMSHGDWRRRKRDDRNGGRGPRNHGDWKRRKRDDGGWGRGVREDGDRLSWIVGRKKNERIQAKKKDRVSGRGWVGTGMHMVSGGVLKKKEKRKGRHKERLDSSNITNEDWITPLPIKAGEERYGRPLSIHGCLHL